jgi:molybdopterin-guanine dinucleotide biosynthesis protein A
MNAQRAIVAVLAGGRGARLGGGKAVAVLGGQTLISYPLRAAREAGLETVVVAKRSSRLPSLAGRVRYEPELPEHPLCGVVRALEYAHDRGAPAVVLLACDMPFVTPGLLGRLAGVQGAAIVELRGRAQPALSRVPARQLPLVREALYAGRSFTEAIAGLEPRVLDEAELSAFGSPEELCFNVNHAEDLQRAELLLAVRLRESRGELAGLSGRQPRAGGDPA